MASLSNITAETRKILEWLGIIVGGILLLVILFNIGVFLKNLFAPTPLPGPTVAFGKLPLETLPQNTNDKTYVYTVNTLTGSLPVLPDRVTVYKLQQPAPNLLSLENATSIAQQAGFLDPPTSLSAISYRWTKSDPPPAGILNMNIQSLDFTYTSSYAADPTVLSATYLPDQTGAETAAKAFFDMIMPLPNYIDPTKTKDTFFAIQNGQLLPATSQSTAQIIRVDYFPQDIDNLPVYTQNPDQSLIYALVASADTSNPQVVEASYFHKATTGDKATYPIINSTTAFDMLKNGNAYVASNPSGSSAVSITSVSLGYYVDATPQTYLLPIIIFQGDQGFYAYVSAIKGEWIQN